jgi:uncharacterized protein (DUF885 family)
MLERLGARLVLHDARDGLLEMRTLGSPMGSIRSVFDQMPRATEDEWANIAARMALVGEALTSFRTTLEAGMDAGITVARRQVRECARQASVWSGAQPDTAPFFAALAATAPASLSGPLREDLDRGAMAANEAYASFARFLLDDYLPQALDDDGCGRERYARSARYFLGADLDPDETYRWAWEELHRIEAEMAATAARIVPGGTVAEARHLLDTDPARSVEGVDAFRAWLQGLHDESLRSLAGVHFDIDPRIMKVEVMIPPPGGPMAVYYSGPSEDFTRPGRTWWPAGTRTRFPKWPEVTTVYHEGVPGHHLQVGATRCLDLTRYQRTMGFVSAHGEGWALYAERLMAELGYLEVPDYHLGMLSMQALRAVRVIVDIGMHLGLAVPAGEPFHPGETWTHDLAVEFTRDRAGINDELVRSEILRYLGWPAQAISYKVGERAWLAAREDARKRAGASFDLKRFHTRALELGPLGLAQLQRELAA